MLRPNTEAPQMQAATGKEPDVIVRLNHFLTEALNDEARRGTHA